MWWHHRVFCSWCASLCSQSGWHWLTHVCSTSFLFSRSIKSRHGACIAGSLISLSIPLSFSYRNPFEAVGLSSFEVRPQKALHIDMTPSFAGLPSRNWCRARLTWAPIVWNTLSVLSCHLQLPARPLHFQGTHPIYTLAISSSSCLFVWSFLILVSIFSDLASHNIYDSRWNPQ